MPSRNLVGIDVGSKFIKAVQVTETSGQYRVTEFGIAEVSPQVSVPDGPSRRTPQRTRSPARWSSNSTLAANAAQPSSAITASIGVSVHPFQLPDSRALLNGEPEIPVR